MGIFDTTIDLKNNNESLSETELDEKLKQFGLDRLDFEDKKKIMHLGKIVYNCDEIHNFRIDDSNLLEFIRHEELIIIRQLLDQKDKLDKLIKQNNESREMNQKLIEQNEIIIQQNNESKEMNQKIINQNDKIIELLTKISEK